MTNVRIHIIGVCFLLLFSVFLGACARQRPNPGVEDEYVCVAQRDGSVFKRAPCIYAKKMEDDDIVEFSSDKEAEAAGLRPCEECIPKRRKSSE